MKNLRKDGGYYWVYATILRKLNPNGEVFTMKDIDIWLEGKD